MNLQTRKLTSEMTEKEILKELKEHQKSPYSLDALCRTSFLLMRLQYFIREKELKNK